MIIWIFITFCVLLLTLFVISKVLKPRPFKLRDSHVFITGGSSGIGLALAKEAVKRSACVTIVARNQKKLEDARKEILSSFPGVSEKNVQIISVDITKDANSVKDAVHKAETVLGPIQMLVNCAGSAISKTFEDTQPEEFKRMIELNYLGSVYTTKAVIPSMKAENGGRVVFVSSQAGQLGLFGYTAYAASKFALRGLAESLQMEVKPYNIRVTLSHPPDTDTPGYAEENITKPRETSLIAETSGLFTPENVASTILNDSINGKFCSYIGLDGCMLAYVTSGMSPVTSLAEALMQIFTMSPFRAICLFYLAHFDRIVSKCKRERETAAGGKDKAN